MLYARIVLFHFESFSALYILSIPNFMSVAMRCQQIFSVEFLVPIHTCLIMVIFILDLYYHLTLVTLSSQKNERSLFNSIDIVRKRIHAYLYLKTYANDV